jgi:hypothetical protein
VGRKETTGEETGRCKQRSPEVQRGKGEFLLDNRDVM